MGFEIIAGAVSAIIAAGSAYYSRQKALPEIKRREICQSLTDLIRSLEAIAVVGEQIYDLLNQRISRDPGSAQVNNLIRALEKQNENLAIARTEFEFLSSVFEIQAPSMGRLIVHLRGKKDRIELIYTGATDLKSQLRSRVEPWETSEPLERPSQLRRVIAHSHNGVHAEVITKPDADFGHIVSVIPELRAFTKESCKMEYLI